MVHYSSHINYYEGGAKNPLKGISMKFLVSAQDAQFRVFSGSKDDREICNGIHSKFPCYRGGLISIKLLLSKTYIKCQDTIYRVACLEW